MSISRQNLSVIIVSFKSDHIIEQCIESIDKEIEIIVIDNSNNTEFKKHLENKYENTRCILSIKNIGMGAGNNMGIKNTNKDFALILNPDVILEKDAINQIINASKTIDTFSIIAPILDKINIPTIKCVDVSASGGVYFFEDYEVGERLNHPEGITIDNSDHTLATKLYQNNAKVHFNDHMMKSTPMGQRLMYGGIIISMARAISFNGLQNAQWVYAINSGNHCNPTYAGDTIYAYSEILEKIEHKRDDIGLLRVRTVALQNQNTKEIGNTKGEDGQERPNIDMAWD